MNYTIREIFNFNRYEHQFKVGDLVKLSIGDVNDQNGESYWFEITEGIGGVPRVENKNTGFIREEAFDIYFKGRADNKPIDDNFPQLNEIIEFNIGNIITYWGYEG